MKELAVIFGAYLGIGLLTCVALAFRKGKSPRAMKAIQLFGVDPNPGSMLLSMILWPVWVFMQIVEQDTLESTTSTEKKEEHESLDALVGCVGKTLTPMMPSGRIRLGGKDYEAWSDDGQMDRDEEVEVLAFSMGTLKVRRFRQTAPNYPA